MKKNKITIIIDKSFQYRTILGIVIICAIGFILEICILNYFIYDKINSLMWKAHIDIKTTGEIITPILIYSLIITLLIILLILFIYMKATIKKIAAPIHRLHREMQSAVNGDLSVKIHLRKEDHFRDVALQLNDMITHVRNAFKIIIDDVNNANRLIEIMKYTIDKPEIFSKKCRELMTVLKHLSQLTNNEKQ